MFKLNIPSRENYIPSINCVYFKHIISYMHKLLGTSVIKMRIYMEQASRIHAQRKIRRQPISLPFEDAFVIDICHSATKANNGIVPGRPRKDIAQEIIDLNFISHVFADLYQLVFHLRRSLRSFLPVVMATIAEENQILLSIGSAIRLRNNMSILFSLSFTAILTLKSITSTNLTLNLVPAHNPAYLHTHSHANVRTATGRIILPALTLKCQSGTVYCLALTSTRAAYCQDFVDSETGGSGNRRQGMGSPIWAPPGD
jgi:hypothetical protein